MLAGVVLGGWAHPSDASAARRSAPARAPGGPALTPGSLETSPEAGVQGSGETAQGEADPLVSNGLASPLCRDALAGQLSTSSRRNCESSGFVAAPAPTGDYGIDVHIDTGLAVVSYSWILSVVQDLFVTPVWMALVWAVHALVVMLEWCYTIDLLDSASSLGIGPGLREMQRTLTAPWLAGVLAVASVLAAYNGLVRRRVAETIGDALVMLAMMTGGLWVALDPTGTLGALGDWANQASLGALAATVRGAPNQAGRVLGDSLGGVFAATIQAPWCYLEFGDVAWCREHARLDPRLHNAGLRIAAAEQTLVGCRRSAASPSLCVPASSAQGAALEHSAQLLRGATSNGAIFLALPPNGPGRNSINEPGSLLRALCNSSQATACRGPTAAQAEFRTGGRTWARVGGLLLIVAGTLGMLLLLGFIALRLLSAALFSLMYLLLAPAVVLAPAFGEGGRTVFRRWAGRLLGAVTAKLVYSFLLGVVIAVVGVIGDLRGLGWWTQWLLTSAFWWGAFTHRHQALGVTGGAFAGERRQPPRPLARRVADAFETPRATLRQVARAREWLARPSPGDGERRAAPRRARRPAGAVGDEQAQRMLEREQLAARAAVQAQPDARIRRAKLQERLGRVDAARRGARATGDTRRVARLEVRAAQIEREMADAESALDQHRSTHAGAGRPIRRAGRSESPTSELLQERARWLDAQAALPGAGRRGEHGERRDYAALAALAGHGRTEYEGLDPRGRREVRMQIDRELSLRRGLRGDAIDPGRTRGHTPAPARAIASGSGSRLAGARSAGSLETATSERRRTERERIETAARRRRSPVLDDAREVAAKRKRQLGRDRD